MFVFVCGYLSHSRIFHSYRDVTIAGVGLQFFLTLARHSWPLSSKGFFANQLWHGTSVYNWGCQYLFLRHMSRLGFEHHAPFHLRRKRSSPLRHHRGHKGIKVHFTPLTQGNGLHRCRIRQVLLCIDHLWTCILFINTCLFTFNSCTFKGILIKFDKLTYSLGKII